MAPMSNADLFYRDLLADAFSSVSAAQWRERAETFRAARPRAEDYPGETTLEQRRDRWRRLTEIAKACDAKADVIERAGTADALVPELAGFSIWEAA